MNLYLGYFAAEENLEGDNPPIGIILTRNKDELLVEYATYQMNSQLLYRNTNSIYRTARNCAVSWNLPSNSRKTVPARIPLPVHGFFCLILLEYCIFHS